MAYAELAGLPPITGRYTSILCLGQYAVFGPSRSLVLGSDSSLGPMIAACVIGQLPKLCGFSVDADGLIAEAAAFGRGLAQSLTVPAAPLVGAGSRSGDRIDGNREMIGIGAANIAAGLFQGFAAFATPCRASSASPPTSSTSRPRNGSSSST